jgi:hypothetical protein
VTAWQLKDGDTPNDHTDASYDEAVIDRRVALPIADSYHTVGFELLGRTRADEAAAGRAL